MMKSFLRPCKASADLVPLALSLAIALAMHSIPSPLQAQSGDRDDHVMAPPPAHWEIPPATVHTPEEALATFEIEEGFAIELVVAEPMVHDPVAIAFDGNGRLWVAEMRGYMPDIDAKLESETYGRISVLEDTTGDGVIDRHTVFLEQFLLPRAVALAGADRSLLFADNLTLYEAEILIDEEGRISAGEVRVVDAAYAEGGNPEHKPNGLVYSLDNWLYNAKSNQRYRKIDGEWTWERTESRGQWGIKQDDYGRLLTNSNSNLLTMEEVAPGLTVRNPAHSFRAPVRSSIKDQTVWPSRITPGVNRGYMEGVLSEDGRLVKPTAVSGLAYYRGDQFPEAYRGNLFIPEPAANLVKRTVVTELENGYREIVSATEDRDFLTSTDERFRIVDAFTAPDGSLYLVDFYRGLIQHQTYLTSYLREQVEERGLHEPLGMGRIWRVRHLDGAPLAAAPRMQEEESPALVAHLAHANGWWRDTAQRILVERGDLSAVPALRETARGHAEPLARVHAIWTLEGLGTLDVETVAAALADPASRVAAEAVRAAESLIGTDGEAGLFQLLSGIEPASGGLHFRRQLAASLGLFGEKGFPHLLAVHEVAGDDPLVPDLVLSGLSGRELAFFQSLPPGHGLRSPLVRAVVRRNQAPEIAALREALADPGEWRTFATEIVGTRRSAAAASLLADLADAALSSDRRRAIASGMIAGGKAQRFTPMPVAELTALAGADALPGVKQEDFEALLALFDIGSGEERNYLLTEADREQFKLGEYHYQALCMACHQAHGNGQEFLGPPIAGSEWVTGSVNRLIAVVLDGVEGPIEVMGRIYTVPEIPPVMPGLRFNPEVTDEQLAAVLTYIRNAWGNAAPPVAPEALTRYRGETEARAPWPASELMKMK